MSTSFCTVGGAVPRDGVSLNGHPHTEAQLPLEGRTAPEIPVALTRPVL